MKDRKASDICTLSKSRSLTRQASSQSVKLAKEIKPKPEGDSSGTMVGKFDCCVYLVHCPIHDKVLLTYQKDQLRWMPFVPLLPNQSWKDGAVAGFCLLLASGNKAKFDAFKDKPPHESFKCMQVLRLQLPQTQKFITRVIYYFKLNSRADNFTCCQAIAPHLEWFPLAEVLQNNVPLQWGPELVEYCKRITDCAKPKLVEFSLEEANKFVPRNPPRNAEEQTLKSLHITQTEVERLYADFLDFCFPSFYLTPNSFRHYLAKHKLDEVCSPQLFDAFNYTGNGYISFHELLLGLACIHPSSADTALRAKFIFRFYNTDKSGNLTEAQLKSLLMDMVPARLVDNILKNAIQAIGDLPWSEERSVAAFGKFSEASALCRSSKAIFASISRSIAMKTLKPSSGCQKQLGNVIIKRNQDKCTACLENKYEVARHMVCIDAIGQVQSKQLNQVEVAPKEDDHVLTAQQYSIECVFKSDSVANIMIKLVREFNNIKGTTLRPWGLMQNRKEILWKLLLALHREIDILLEEEPKCQKVFSPCYIIGDIHGNLEDLLSIERSLWKQVPCIGASYLFLGDYVDRGKWGLECSLFLIAFKILCPRLVTLLRGNHEVRSLQSHYSYKRECLFKYGEQFGLKIWELTNRVFDRLPVCALLDDTIFCAHGGIPCSAQTIEQINSMPREIIEPQHDAIIAHEIVWSDPAHLVDFLDTCAIRGVDPDTSNGFVFNTKRGTAFKFSEMATSDFLRTNLLTHIIRAHEVVLPGYGFHFNGKCATIFSSSHYCGNDNECGLILADNQRLRVLHIDTANNFSATD